MGTPCPPRVPEGNLHTRDQWPLRRCPSGSQAPGKLRLWKKEEAGPPASLQGEPLSRVGTPCPPCGIICAAQPVFLVYSMGGTWCMAQPFEARPHDRDGSVNCEWTCLCCMCAGGLWIVCMRIVCTLYVVHICVWDTHVGGYG